MDVIRKVFTTNGEFAGLYRLEKDNNIYIWKYMKNTMIGGINSNYQSLTINISVFDWKVKFKESDLDGDC